MVFFVACRRVSEQINKVSVCLAPYHIYKVLLRTKIVNYKQWIIEGRFLPLTLVKYNRAII